MTLKPGTVVTPELSQAVASGTVTARSGPDINTGELCRVFARTDRPGVLWLPDDQDREVVLKNGLEGEGEWLVATFSGGLWTVVRDFWNETSGESDEETVFSTLDRDEAISYVVAHLLT